MAICDAIGEHHLGGLECRWRQQPSPRAAMYTVSEVTNISSNCMVASKLAIWVDKYNAAYKRESVSVIIGATVITLEEEKQN